METNHEARACRAWELLVQCAASRQLTNYVDLGQSIGGVHQRAVGFALGPIQNFCLEEKLPPLTILVVQKASGQPGGGFIAWDVDDISTALARVYGFPWQDVANPFAYAADDATTLKVLAARLLADPDSSREVYSLVRVRGIAQQLFRAALLDAYDECAFCGLTFLEALEGAHIVPWASCSPSERLDARNGLLLCRNHHALFDSGELDVDREWRIVDAQSYADDDYSPADVRAARDLAGRTVTLPADERLRPRWSYFERRRQLRSA